MPFRSSLPRSPDITLLGWLRSCAGISSTFNRLCRNVQYPPDAVRGERAWRHLDRFVPGYPRSGWTPLRAWLHRIAHREFLQSLRSQRPLTSLEEIGELPAPLTAPWTDAVELRALLSELPLQEREVVALHDLEGYTAAEIAAMMDAPATTVNYRLRQARNRLRRERGERAGSYSPIPSMIL